MPGVAPEQATAMTRARRRRPARITAAWNVAIALWSAVPGIQWCSVSWAEVTDECLVSCATAEAFAPEAGCGPCPAEGAACDADTEPRASERAFCLHGPVGGSGISPGSPLANTDDPSASTPADDPVDVAPVCARVWTLAVDTDVGPQPPRGERPPIRAPPTS